MQETKLQVENRGQVRVETVHGQRTESSSELLATTDLQRCLTKRLLGRKSWRMEKRPETSNGLDSQEERKVVAIVCALKRSLQVASLPAK